MHNEADGHAIDPSGPCVPRSTGDHAPLPPVGSVDVTTALSLLPARPPAPTHSDRVGQASDSITVPTDTGALHAPGPPVGLVEVNTSPAVSLTTQRVVEGHEMAENVWPGAIDVVCHAPAPPVGSVEVTMLPFLAVPTHREAEGHEIAITGSGLTVAVLHNPPAGSVEVATLPSPSVARHHVDDRQVSDANPLGFPNGAA